MQRRFYLSFRSLTGRNYPSRVLRGDGMTLQIIDPRATALECHEATVDLLEPWEYAAAREAYGQPPPGQPVDDELMDGMVMPFVPEAIRVPGEMPVQALKTDTPGHHCAYGRAFAWFIHERWGDLGLTAFYHHPGLQQQHGAA